MSRSFGPFGGSVPPVTKVLLIVVVAGSILDAVVSRWLGLFDLGSAAALVGDRVLGGEVWRLLTYPWLAGDPLALIFGAVMLYFFATPLENGWGRRRLLWRLAVLVTVPAAATVLLGSVVSRVGGYPYAGLGPLGIALVTAFASSNRGARVALFPFPIVLEADQLLWLEGGMLLLWMLFAGTTVPFIPEVLSFALALAWFRLGLDFGLARSWRSFQASRAQAHLDKLRQKRGLRVVRDDDPKFLH